MKNTPKFIVAENLGKLAKWLRFLGYDTIVLKAVGFNNKIRISRKDGRIYITRSRKEASSNISFPRRLILSERYIDQLQEITDLLSLDKDRIFTRCSLCNSRLFSIEKERIKDLIPDYIYEHHDEFRLCRKCGKIYWQGSHFDDMMKTVKKVFERTG